MIGPLSGSRIRQLGFAIKRVKDKLAVFVDKTSNRINKIKPSILVELQSVSAYTSSCENILLSTASHG